MSTTAEDASAYPGSVAERGPVGTHINLGCGPVMADRWINVDGSLRAWLVSHAWPLDQALVRLGLIPKTAFKPGLTYHNLKKPLPWTDRSIAAIYAGEVWEHLEYEDARRLTKECFRVLMTGGILRLCVPDGVEFWQRYLAMVHEEQARPSPERDIARVRAHVQMYYNDICTRPPRLTSFSHFHKWQYDELQLTDLMTGCGFEKVERHVFGVSRMSDIRAVERSDFLIVEGIKP